MWLSGAMPRPHHVGILGCLGGRFGGYALVVAHCLHSVQHIVLTRARVFVQSLSTKYISVLC
jgi:hypothetical protein